MNVRTNHVHAVVSAPGVSPERVMNDFKAYATRSLRQRKLVGRDQKVWAYHGSMPRIWKPDQLARAIRYVNDAQGPELPMMEVAANRSRQRPQRTRSLTLGALIEGTGRSHSFQRALT